MLIRFKPVYGYGWFDSTGLIDEPPPFQLEAAAGADRVEGIVTEPGHPLTGMWISLTMRTQGEPPHYNVEAFLKRTDETPAITGFAALS
jgi:hypothetical protein